MKKLLAIMMVLVLVFALSTSSLADDPPNTGKTEVQFKVDNAQISVTVPTTLAATVTASTGALTFADQSTYIITNSSAFAVKVSSISCVAETGWTLVSTPSGTDDIQATVTPTGGTAVNLLTSAQTPSGASWNIAANGGTLGLTVAGQINTPGAKTQALTATEATAFTITYTVAAGSN